MIYTPPIEQSDWSECYNHGTSLNSTPTPHSPTHALTAVNKAVTLQYKQCVNACSLAVGEESTATSRASKVAVSEDSTAKSHASKISPVHKSRQFESGEQ